jgi:hypothetical protein
MWSLLLCVISVCTVSVDATQNQHRRRQIPVPKRPFAPQYHPPSRSGAPFPAQFAATPLTEHDPSETTEASGMKEQSADGNKILQWNRNAIRQLAYVVPHENAVLKEMHANIEADQKYRAEQAVKQKVEEGVKLGEVKNKQKDAITKEKVFQFAMDKTNEEFKKRAAEEAHKSSKETKRQADEQFQKDQHMAEAFTHDQQRQQSQFALEFKLWKEQVRHEDELLNEQKVKLLKSLERSTKIALGSHEHSEESSEEESSHFPPATHQLFSSSKGSEASSHSA